jgi:hypothetical protein
MRKRYGDQPDRTYGLGEDLDGDGIEIGLNSETGAPQIE